MPAQQPIYVGILGYGKIGTGTYRTLLDNQASIDRKVGRPVRVKRLVDVDWEAPRPVTPDIPAAMKSTKADDVLDDPEISIVVECIGGTKPALEFVLKALRAGKNVVTSNKELIARHGKDLFDTAAQRGLDLMFEGSVGGGIPIVRPLKSCLAGNRIQRVMGIVNGTTNFILTRMAQEKAEFKEALAEATRLGYAEPDPTNDIEGFDAAFKLAILASIAFETRVQVEDIHREGITKLAARDMEYATQLGYAVKLLAIGAEVGGGLELRVHPTFLPSDHPLASVNGPFNAIFVRGSSVGEVMFYGQGAGMMPTGSAMVGDIIDVARNIVHGSTGRVACTCFDEKAVRPIDELDTRYYVRLQVADRPGVLAAIATVFGEEGVSLASVLQMGASGQSAEIVWLTHRTQEGRMRRSLERLEALREVHEISACIRAEGEG
ncbi:MAG: homoserine dehydrogenase [Armatimonadota bacterium]